MQITVEMYETSEGRCPFQKYLKDLTDIRAHAKIRIRLERLRMGNFGNCESVGGGVFELKINFGPGYRVYFGKIDMHCVLLLCAGTKRDQQRDIEKAKELFKDFKNRGG